MSFTPQQDAALAQAHTWFTTSSEQIFRVFGYAGTGKTTLARHFAENIKGQVQYGAFTGKACQVLRNKGCHNAKTIHSMIYKAEPGPDGHMRFVLNPESPLRYCKLIILDEVSMVGEELARDLMSFGKKILVLGDPFQLPPVKSEGFFTATEPDVMLTEVHRQAAENPILRLSMEIRQGKQIRRGDYGALQIVPPGELSVKQVLAFDQLICGKNASRDAYNKRMRGLKGFEGQFPNVGERLICLRNDSTNGLFNGQMWEVQSIAENDGSEHETRRAHLVMEMKSLDDEGRAACEVLKECFTGGIKDVPWYHQRAFNEFDFGYAITCHKSQGSQWNKVLVFDESHVFRDTADRWLYTAVTRAAEELTIVR